MCVVTTYLSVVIEIAKITFAKHSQIFAKHFKIYFIINCFFKGFYISLHM
jgi:hypothetical protein